MVPIVASITNGGEDNEQGLYKPKIHGLESAQKYAGYAGGNKVDTNKWIINGFGMCDFLFGIAPERSFKSSKATGDSFNRKRLNLYRKPRGTTGSLEGTAPLEIKQYMSEDEALDEITAFPARMIVGFVMGPRDVKLYYTETAIAMMVRRMRQIVEACGPQKPQYFPIGLGHLENGNGKPWKPSVLNESGKTPHIRQPSGVWNAGAVQYKSAALKATGTLYIPWDQTPYSSMRRNFKYNHIMTQIGMEMLETLQAVGIDMNEKLKGDPITAFNENNAGAQVAGLQMLFSSMFGTTTTHSATSDFTVDETSVASGLKDRMGMLFNSGHIHLDPGVFSFERTNGVGFLNTDGDRVGMLSQKTDSDLAYKDNGKNVSADLLFKEFIAKYICFNVAAQCLENYFAVPLY